MSGKPLFFILPPYPLGDTFDGCCSEGLLLHIRLMESVLDSLDCKGLTRHLSFYAHFEFNHLKDNLLKYDSSSVTEYRGSSGYMRISRPKAGWAFTRYSDPKYTGDWSPFSLSPDDNHGLDVSWDAYDYKCLFLAYSSVASKFASSRLNLILVATTYPTYKKHKKIKKTWKKK